ncbi:MAG TPA: hypothetical protein DCQ06_08660 [Myxococcales bacterium]|nr:hypothetical protein [Myxococcales bacterium]
MNQIKALTQHPKFAEINALRQRITEQLADKQAQVEELQANIAKSIVSRGHDIRAAGVRLCETSGDQLISGLTAQAQAHADRHPALERLVGDLEQMKAQHLALCAEFNAPPLSDFDTLTAKRISTEIASLPLWKVEAVRRYESANKKRGTVIRACEARFAA